VLPPCEVTLIGRQLRKHGFASLDIYLASPAWKAKREAKYRETTKRKKTNYRCHCCNRRASLALHHLTYERLGEELMKDLVWVCSRCHGLIHKHKTLVNPRYAHKRLKIATKYVRRMMIRSGLWEEQAK
jgi:hypothetical protein